MSLSEKQWHLLQREAFEDMEERHSELAARGLARYVDGIYMGTIRPIQVSGRQSVPSYRERVAAWWLQVLTRVHDWLCRRIVCSCCWDDEY